MRKAYKLSREDSKKIDSSRESYKLTNIYANNKGLIDNISKAIEKLKQEEKTTSAKALEKLKQESITEKEILEIILNKKKYFSIPLSIFKSELSPLEAVTQYLIEEGYKLHEIAKKLNRDDRSIWTTLNNARKKKVLLKTDSEEFIPLEILADRRLSILENISHHLKEERGYSLKKISLLLGKDSRTIWTVYNRAKQKLKK